MGAYSGLLSLYTLYSQLYSQQSSNDVKFSDGAASPKKIVFYISKPPTDVTCRKKDPDRHLFIWPKVGWVTSCRGGQERAVLKIVPALVHRAASRYRWPTRHSPSIYLQWTRIIRYNSSKGKHTQMGHNAISQTARNMIMCCI
jgi:hypothetical protein